MLMGIKVFFTKKGEFPNTHIGGSKAMRDRGISCATSQDREASNRESLIEKIIKELLVRYNAEYAFLFGSYARGNQTENSDIDVLVFGGENFKKSKKNYPLL